MKPAELAAYLVSVLRTRNRGTLADPIDRSNPEGLLEELTHILTCGGPPPNWQSSDVVVVTSPAIDRDDEWYIQAGQIPKPFLGINPSRRSRAKRLAMARNAPPYLEPGEWDEYLEAAHAEIDELDDDLRVAYLRTRAVANGHTLDEKRPGHDAPAENVDTWAPCEACSSPVTCHVPGGLRMLASGVMPHVLELELEALVEAPAKRKERESCSTG